MKKVILSLMLCILTITFASCSNAEDTISVFKDNSRTISDYSTEEDNMGVFINNNEKIADNTFNKIIDAIKTKDNSKIVDIFSNSVKSTDELSLSASKFVDYIQGDIISFSSASESGVGTDHKKEDGKTKKEIQSAFCIKTTQNTYYIAIKECIKDEFDENNVGVLSIYIIESTNWKNDYIYRGDGKWTHGINIVDSF